MLNADPLFVQLVGIVQVLEAVVQTWKVMPFRAVVTLGVKVNVQVAAVLPAEVLSASLRLVIWPAEADCGKSTQRELAKITTTNMAKCISLYAEVKREVL